MRVRQPAVSGLFYPDDPDEVSDFISPLLQGDAPQASPHTLIGPHAGYVYSGAICANGYAGVEVPGTVIVMGPNHTGFGQPNAIYAHGAFAIPGAELPIEENLARELADALGLVDDERAHRQEHSIEVHLPFLHAKNPNVRIVPICLGNLSRSECERMGHALAAVQRKHSDVMVVVSTDMSHYVPASDAERLDKMALDRVVAVDPKGLYETVTRHNISMCGYIPTTVALYAATEMGKQKGSVVRYGNSGEASGDYGSVVGYASATIG